jgi:hypothetical protein
MTPKEKAEDLKQMFSHIGQTCFHREDAKNFSKIAVRLILDSARYTEYHYWLEVKKELDKM